MPTLQERVQVNAPIHDCYAQWLNVEDFPSFMPHVKHVEKKAEGRWHWQVAVSSGLPLEWDAVLDANLNDTVISWHSVPDTPHTQDANTMVANTGKVEFSENTTEPLTDVTLTVEYNVPAGIIGEGIANLIADPKQMLKDSLQYFKQSAEAAHSARRAEELT